MTAHQIVLKCDRCGHIVRELDAIIAKRTMFKAAARAGVIADGPFCRECKLAGRPDSSLIETTIDVELAG